MLWTANMVCMISVLRILSRFVSWTLIFKKCFIYAWKYCIFPIIIVSQVFITSFKKFVCSNLYFCRYFGLLNPSITKKGMRRFFIMMVELKIFPCWFYFHFIHRHALYEATLHLEHYFFLVNWTFCHYVVTFCLQCFCFKGLFYLINKSYNAFFSICMYIFSYSFIFKPFLF